MHSSFAGKNIVVGVTGSIAAFKVAGWVSYMTKEEALVDVVMTESAQRFVTPLTFGALSGRRVYTDMFNGAGVDPMSHISLAREADCVIVAPATAQSISRLAMGQASDLLSTLILAADIPIIVCPAMNVKMYEHPATRKNLATLREYGYKIVNPSSGLMACGEEGDGRLPGWKTAEEYILREISSKDLAGQRVLITAGPTREPYDPARYLSNRSSGKMGYALARTAFRRGAEVTLISGPTSLDKPEGVRFIPVSTALEMRDAVINEFETASVIIKAAAVADFRCAEYHAEKEKKTLASLNMKLEPNPDILKELGKRCDHSRQLLVGFAAESSNFEREARKKLDRKNLEMIAVNNIASDKSGFEVDCNQVTLVEKDRSTPLPHTSKIRTADLIWDHIVDNRLLRNSG